MQREEHGKSSTQGPSVTSAKGGAERDLPSARSHAEVLARRLARPLGLDDRNPSAVLADAKHPAAPALHALGALARRLRARSVDAVLTPDSLFVSVHSELAVPASGRVYELASAAFQRPLALHAGKAVSIAQPAPSLVAQRAAASSARAYLARMRAMECEALRDVDPEGAHELRVAARRARTATRLLSAVDRDPQRAAAWEDLHNVVRAAAALAGAVRDRDVFLEALHGSLPLSPAARDAAVRFIERDRRRHYERMAKSLRSTAHARNTARCDAALRDALESPPADHTGGASPDARPLSGPALDEAARAFTDKQLRGLRKRFEADLTHTEGLHDVRRAMRRVRDVVELFGDSLREGQRSLRKRMQPVQSLLGSLNDVYVAQSLLPQRAGAPPAWELELRAVLTERQRELEVRLAVPLAVLAATLVHRW